MPPPYVHFKYRRSLLPTAVVLSLAIFWLVGSHGTPVGFAQGGPPAPFRNFEAPQIHPLALTPDGTRLLAVNTPNATLSVFQLVLGSPVLTAEIPVGLEPVSVAARNNREAWVVNWMSDSVSIVDLTTGNVVRTIDVGDEPTDVIFAGPGNNKAFVCVSGGALETIGFSQITGWGGAVKVFDPNDPSVPLTTIENIGKQPRALARNADGSRVFVTVFESGNQTTIVPETIVGANGGLPPPNPAVRPGLPVPPNTSLIVKWDGSNWKDEISRSWTAHIPYTLADSDLAVIDASVASPFVSARVRGIGTHVGNMAFDPSTQRLFVANLEDINQVRFEPNLSGKFQASRISILNAAVPTPAVVTTSDLNSHVDFGNPAGSDSERVLSLALPTDVVRQSDGTVYVAATSSARVGVLSSAGAVTGRIGVGQGPTGLALDEARQRLYVLNRFDQTLSVVDTVSKTQLSQLDIGFNPEPAAVRDGRRFLYDATSFSAHGTVSCASCHLNGHRDGIVWDLGNPLGDVEPVSTFLPPNITGADNQHPMKGPMMTQSLRGIISNEPFHWRGDRAGLENFNGAFVSLLGGHLLSNEEMAEFKAFVQSLTYPPNPNHPQNRTPNEFLGGGFGFFNFNQLFGPPGPSGTINCSQCHLVTNFRVGSDNRITPKTDLQESQSVKVAPFRGLYQKIGMNKAGGTPGGELTGFGFSHDGSFDNLFNFQKAPQFNFGQAGGESTADGWRRNIEAMILQFDTGTAPAVGLMVTVNATNKSSFDVTNRINDVLVPEAQAGNCDLIVRGIYGGSPHGFVRLSNGMFQPDSLSEAPVTLQTLLNAVGTGAELTFMGVPQGEGRLLALDRNGNGILNDDEPPTSVSITGRVVNASGAGLAGVTVTLSGTQSATTVTDASGRFVFNFISMAGTHTVTPSGGPFTPLSRTFTSPIWNQSATFSASPTGNASEASQFYVTQHYLDFLNRDPDAAGLAFWIDQIESCGGNPDCRQARRDNVSGAFFLSIEFQETGFLAYRAYKASFGDINPPTVPVPVTFPQLMTDTQRIGRNVIVNPSGDWQPLLEANKVAFFTGWVQRLEFLARFPVGMSAADFVNALNGNTGNSLTPSEAQTLINQLAANNTTQGRAAAVRQVSENAEFTRREKNKAFVLMQYFGYLRRNPNDPPEIGLDFAGYNFWLTKLNQHNGNFIQAEMVKSFIVSGEYRRRFGL
jgi:YVTN family beta-propeller protein